jgi:16S rRNA (uracil1498-N3)-methyltransferase
VTGSAVEPSGAQSGWKLRRSAVAHVVVADLGGDDDLALDDAAEHHLRRVLRVRNGELVSLTDLSGSWRCATAEGDRGGLRLVPVSPTVTEREPTRRLTIAVAIPKGDRLDWMVQKTTELGVAELVLLRCDRSATAWPDDRIEAQLDRLRRIAVEACRQSRRIWGVTINGPVSAHEVLTLGVMAEPGGRPIAAHDSFIAVGPEGGWSSAELDLANETVSIGPNILRTETAAVAVTALSVGFSHGEWT